MLELFRMSFVELALRIFLYPRSVPLCILIHRFPTPAHLFNFIFIRFEVMKVLIFVLCLVVLICSRNYPMYKQCDPAWAHDQLGTSATNTICSAGCAMSSVAMGLSGVGSNYNPGTLNQWLKAHGGYVSGDLIVWSAVAPLGLTFDGKFANHQIKSKLDAAKVVVINVNNGAHWVLATGYSGDNILVNDPNHPTSSYALSTIVEGNNVVYSVKASFSLWNIVESMKILMQG